VGLNMAGGTSSGQVEIYESRFCYRAFVITTMERESEHEEFTGGPSVKPAEGSAAGRWRSPQPFESKWLCLGCAAT